MCLLIFSNSFTILKLIKHNSVDNTLSIIAWMIFGFEDWNLAFSINWVWNRREMLKRNVHIANLLKNVLIFEFRTSETVWFVGAWIRRSFHPSKFNWTDAIYSGVFFPIEIIIKKKLIYGKLWMFMGISTTRSWITHTYKNGIEYRILHGILIDPKRKSIISNHIAFGWSLDK